MTFSNRGLITNVPSFHNQALSRFSVASPESIFPRVDFVYKLKKDKVLLSHYDILPYKP